MAVKSKKPPTKSQPGKADLHANGKPAANRGRPRKDRPADAAPLAKTVQTSPPFDWSNAERLSVPYEGIEAHPDNVRKTFDQGELEKTRDSLDKIGQLDELKCRPHPRPHGKVTYQLADGEFRWRSIGLLPKGHKVRRACRIAVLPLTDEQVLTIMLTTRTQSHPLKPSEEAAGFVRLAETHTAEQIAGMVGYETAYVRTMLRLTRLPSFFAHAVDGGRVPISTAELIARIPAPIERTRAAVRVLLNGTYTGNIYSAESIGADLTKIQLKELEEIAREPASFRDTKEMIARDYMVQLKGKRFDMLSLTLVPEAGSCEACPKRAANDPDARADGIRGDMCLDPRCCLAKQRAAAAADLAEARLAGIAILSAEDAANVFSDFGGINPAAPYADVDAKSYQHPFNGRTPREALGTINDVHLTVGIHPKEGKMYTLMKKSYAVLAATANRAASTAGCESAAGCADNGEAERQEKAAHALENKIFNRTVERFLTACHTNAVTLFTTVLNPQQSEEYFHAKDFFRAIAAEHLNKTYHNELRHLFRRYGHWDRKAFDAKIRLLDTAGLLAFIVELMMLQRITSTGHIDREELESALSVSSDEIRQEVTAEMTKKGKVKV